MRAVPVASFQIKMAPTGSIQELLHKSVLLKEGEIEAVEVIPNNNRVVS